MHLYDRQAVRDHDSISTPNNNKETTETGAFISFWRKMTNAIHLYDTRVKKIVTLFLH